MTLDEVLKTGYVQIEKMNESIQSRCSVFGLYEQSVLYMTSIVTGGYHVLMCDDRVLAVPRWICREIQV